MRDEVEQPNLIGMKTKKTMRVKTNSIIDLERKRVTCELMTKARKLQI